MNNLLQIREQLKLTQEELAEKSGISVRTIQRIEAGQSPKGYTLKALIKALEVEEIDLVTVAPMEMENSEVLKWNKIINFSALPLLLIPPLNVLFPLVLMYLKKQNNHLNRQVISIQILATLVAIVLFIFVLILTDWLEIKSKFIELIPLAWVFANAVIIVRNAIEIGKGGKLHIWPNINIF
ncbi:MULTISPECIES: helix-turn-helix domain-containing protein [Sphingobacterium]|uniref:helix-turn-helix domain-containing protein n=1 Tax=Sphingobacterium TaxID=28453 RepID=UPI0022438B04|nr:MULTISPECIES: helix-turn-helix transcriptional regulator [Sphingobacterium]MCW8311195.1 helix-turn-helix transcriptional regulator [Sphingobacterium sp. InxBP1]